MKFKIISGGQSGADRGALLGARAAGFETGGTAPKGWRTDEGPRPDLADLGLIEGASSDYSHRTEINVTAAGMTILVGDLTSVGSALTQRLARSHMRPLVTVNWPRSASEYGTLDEHVDVICGFVLNVATLTGSRTINVAGNRERVNPGIEAFTADLIERLCRDLDRVKETAR